MPDFLYDDFFIPSDDPGIEKVVTIKGRAIPIRFKREAACVTRAMFSSPLVSLSPNDSTTWGRVKGITEGK